jgi:predicted nucleic acid-binding protein
MKILFDTSVIVSGIVESHPMHTKCLPWLQSAKAGDFECVVAAHTLAETYAVLTALPVKPRISPLVAKRLIEINIENTAKIFPLTIVDYRSTIERMAQLGICGGTVYDALIATVARRLAVDKLLTLNADDFYRAWPEGKKIIATPWCNQSKELNGINGPVLLVSLCFFPFNHSTPFQLFVLCLLSFVVILSPVFCMLYSSSALPALMPFHLWALSFIASQHSFVAISFLVPVTKAKQKKLNNLTAFPPSHAFCFHQLQFNWQNRSEWYGVS